MISGKTETGFEFEITDERADNYEVVKTLRRWIDGDFLAFFGLPGLLLGPDGEKALEEHCRAENGAVSKSAMTREIMEIIGYKQVKN